jgi:hypothetical protein
MLSARVLLALAVAVVIAGGSGCSSGPAPPKTYPVSGQVITKEGQPLAGGVVEFHSTSEPALTTLGDIEPDGKFTLRTLFQGQNLPGAVQGGYEVTVFFPMDGDRRGTASVRLPQPYTVEAKENHFKIEVERPEE